MSNHFRGTHHQAEELVQRAIAILEKAKGKEASALIAPLKGYEKLLRKIHREADADNLGDRAKAIEIKDEEQNAWLRGD